MFFKNLGPAIPTSPSIELMEQIISDFGSFDKFKKTLEDYSIGSCLNSKTEIFFDSATHRLEIKKNKISFTDKINLSKVNEYFEVELIKGENMISISCDGISEDARIEIIYN